ncbi:hypothetical protein [Marinibactrum halimedae]|uniref:Uncharacterized protein n=1 Tax=Marinibactrum halimedae TaxID=1444977 RepID=A0AA37WKT3_9GAMM|nr:hypothetical protein [Marinibactrum halimedae]MCD9457693.1 hypothetical protein [Marinibactrum halimedae]GLS24934.1 hypothetical protein GCM10007877_06480 [Marinibactrum halimedae]
MIKKSLLLAGIIFSGLVGAESNVNEVDLDLEYPLQLKEGSVYRFPVDLGQEYLSIEEVCVSLELVDKVTYPTSPRGLSVSRERELSDPYDIKIMHLVSYFPIALRLEEIYDENGEVIGFKTVEIIPEIKVCFPGNEEVYLDGRYNLRLEVPSFSSDSEDDLKYYDVENIKVTVKGEKSLVSSKLTRQPSQSDLGSDKIVNYNVEIVNNDFNDLEKTMTVWATMFLSNGLPYALKEPFEVNLKYGEPILIESRELDMPDFIGDEFGDIYEIHWFVSDENGKIHSRTNLKLLERAY